MLQDYIFFEENFRGSGFSLNGNNGLVSLIWVKAIENTDKTDCCIGFAGHPEKHKKAPDLDKDTEGLKEKVEAGERE